MPPLPTPDMADREERRAWFLEELVDASERQVVARDLPAIAEYIRLHPEGGWSEYAGSGPGSPCAVSYVTFLDPNEALPARYLVEFSAVDERTSKRFFAREDLILLKEE